MEIIDYTGCEIEVVDAARLHKEYVAERLRNKVVLVGDTADTKDTYRTPLHDAQAGVLIHAYALQTILGGSYIEEYKDWVNWTIAVLIGMLLISGLLCAIEYQVLNLFVRVGQFALMYLLIVWGCAIYSRTHMYADFTPAILMLGFGALSFDIIYALYSFVRNIVEKIKTCHKK